VAGLSGDQATAKKLMDKLVKNQTKDGFVDGGVTSITRSGGEDQVGGLVEAGGGLFVLRNPEALAQVREAVGRVWPKAQ
jgi:hypothetical protein